MFRVCGLGFAVQGLGTYSLDFVGAETRADDTESITVYNSSSMLQILCVLCVCECVCELFVCVSIKFVIYTYARTCIRVYT